MANRKCRRCGQIYTDRTGHGYDVCVILCEKRVAWAERELTDAKSALVEAHKIRAEDWWDK